MKFSDQTQLIPVQFRWLDPEQTRDLNPPAYQSDLASGMDVAAAVSKAVVIEPGGILLLPTGFAVAVTPGYELQVRPRSGLAVKHGITIINSPGTIDADYRGEVKIGIINLSKVPFTINRGDRIAQLIPAKVPRVSLEIVDELDKTVRHGGGFGHTGVK